MTTTLTFQAKKMKDSSNESQSREKYIEEFSIQLTFFFIKMHF